MDRESILTYWFEGVDDSTVIKKKKNPFKKWFVSSRRTDEEIKLKFKEALVEAEKGQHKSWEERPLGQLALILLFDQFSRNIYRHTPQMYVYDAQAQKLSLQMIHEGRERELQLIERLFLYMPLMHAEDLKLQRLSVEYFKKLVEESRHINPANTSYYEYHLSYAQKYEAIISVDGRFLHRDIILNRSFI